MELEKCPFCGSTKLKVESKSAMIGTNGLDVPVDRYTYSVRCNVCHARGPARGGKVLRYTLNLELPDWAKTQSELYEQAIEAWNRRFNESTN